MRDSHEMPSVDMTEEKQGTGEHPFWQDLNPDFLAGENYGEQGPHPAKTGRNAYNTKGANNLLQNFTDDELRQIPILPTGSRLEQGAVYIDLQAQRSELKALGNMTAGENNWFVPKSDVPYWLWNKLVGVQNPERLDQTDEGAS